VLLVSPIGWHLKYVVQLAFPREGHAGGTVECEGLLASLTIAEGLGVTRLSVSGDSQLTADPIGMIGMSPLMKASCGNYSTVTAASGWNTSPMDKTLL
jgi:ribonuclease HI